MRSTLKVGTTPPPVGSVYPRLVKRKKTNFIVLAIKEDSVNSSFFRGLALHKPDGSVSTEVVSLLKEDYVDYDGQLILEN